MIKKMTKYSIIAFQPELMDFLNGLQELGVMDITRSSRAFDDYSRQSIYDIKEVKDTVRKLKAFIEVNKEIEAEKVVIDSAEQKRDVVNRLFTDLDLAKAKLASLTRERNEALIWGDFNPSDVERLMNMGFTPHFYSISTKRYNQEWEQIYPIKVLSNENEHICFVVVAPTGEPYSFPIAESKFPEQPASAILVGMEIESASIASITRQLLGMGIYIPDLEGLEANMSEDLDKYFALKSSASEADNSLSVLEGFAPTEQDNEVQAFLNQNDVVYFAEAAKEEDNPPIKLKNNWFAKLFEPIGNLYVLPTYNELDLTPYFAPFYMLFFGLCLGDMGYGLVLVLAGLGVMWKMPKMKDLGKLVLFLGIGTIIMPMLNGTFFGTKIYDIIPMPDNIVNLFFSDIKMFWFAIIFGVFQIIVAKIVNAIYKMSRQGLIYGLSDIGWSFILVWVSFMYAGSQSGKEYLPSWLNYGLAGGGLLLILCFSKTEGNVFKRIFGGITSLYDITSLFGDVLSYIRLFGLGASGACLGMVINSMSMSLKGIPFAGWILCIVLLVFGHLFVMALSALGAFVHPMRLTFVEFYKNAGFVGGGKEYKPLKKRNK